MRIHGMLSAGGWNHLVDWTIDENGEITSAGGLNPSGLTVSGILTIPAQAAEEVAITDDYDNMTVVDLRVLLTERGEPIYGNKSDLINRLRDWDATNPDGLSGVVEETVEDSGESDEAVVSDESTGDTSE
jgi:hypothetical protein